MKGYLKEGEKCLTIKGEQKKDYEGETLSIQQAIKVVTL